MSLLSGASHLYGCNIIEKTEKRTALKKTHSLGCLQPYGNLIIVTISIATELTHEKKDERIRGIVCFVASTETCETQKYLQVSENKLLQYLQVIKKKAPTKF